jgi:serine/threonine-protein kinase HipA
MAGDSLKIWVYADLQETQGPALLGFLHAQQTRGKMAFGFEYDPSWLNQKNRTQLDPEIGWFAGIQYPSEKQNFGIFSDSMPDTWGRTLMKRRAAIMAKEQKKVMSALLETDFLLGVFDETRMGALRFKLNPNGPFLDDNEFMPTPPWNKVRELQFAAENFESDKENAAIREWINILIAPGSSLGGARPKANIIDENGQLWIAKFPSKNDETDKAAWEYLTHLLAKQCGIHMAECRLESVSGKHRTFFTKRFDRNKSNRIHFASGMTMVGKTEEMLRDANASYLELAEAISVYGAQPETDLHQLWRRIVFNMVVSNTDDHLRNHGFLLTSKGWVLSPAFDLNPSIDKPGLSLNVDESNNELSLELAKSVGAYFRLSTKQMNSIISEITKVVSGWQKTSKLLGIARSEQEVMSGAFRC